MQKTYGCLAELYGVIRQMHISIHNRQDCINSAQKLRLAVKRSLNILEERVEYSPPSLPYRARFLTPSICMSHIFDPFNMLEGPSTQLVEYEWEVDVDEENKRYLEASNELWDLLGDSSL